MAWRSAKDLGVRFRVALAGWERLPCLYTLSASASAPANGGGCGAPPAGVDVDSISIRFAVRAPSVAEATSFGRGKTTGAERRGNEFSLDLDAH